MPGRRRQPTGVVLLLLLLLGTGRARACEEIAKPQGAPSPTPFTLEARVQSADVIFEGEVVGHEHGKGYGPAIVEIARYLKGSGPATVLVRGFGAGLDCLPMVGVGQRGLFYATGDPQEVLLLDMRESDYDWPRREVDEVVALVGHGGVAPGAPRPGPTDTAEVTSSPASQVGRATSTPDERPGSGSGVEHPWLLLAGAIALGAGLGAAFWLIRRRRGQ